MNTCSPLFVPELFHCILDCLADPEDRKTLVALAQTCSAFSNPSLNRLWRCLDSLMPLIRSFARDVDEARVKVRTHSNCLLRVWILIDQQTPPSPQEWLVINRYSSRIQELTLGTRRIPLYFLRSSNLVLPNLKVLRRQCRDRITTQEFNEAVSCHWKLLHTEMVTLEMDFPVKHPGVGFQSFLENYPLLYPHLKSIRFHFFSRTPGLPKSGSPALLRAVCSRTDWERVELSCPLDEATLRHLALCSTPKVLSLDLLPGQYFGRTETPFRNVTSLTLTLWCHPEVMMDILRPHDQAFHAIEVTFMENTQMTAADLSGLLTAIVSPCRIRSLQSLVVRHFHYSPTLPDGERSEVLYETLLLIAPLKRLRKLGVHLYNKIAINDDELASLVRNWPCLEELQLTGGSNEYGYCHNAVDLRGQLSLLMSRV